LINHAAFNKAFQADKTGDLITKFVRCVKASTGRNQTNMLLDFITTNLPSRDIEDYTHLPIQVQEWEAGNATQINTIIKQGFQPYIPGSSLKGAIKTAFLHDWLVNTPEGRQKLEALKWVINSRSENRFKDFDLESSLFQDISVASKNQQSMNFSHFRVSDTALLLQKSLCVYHTTRFHLKPRDGSQEAMLRILLPLFLLVQI
jgi:CRISPR type III-A-associated RAMP protein Csm5